jgi:hypothetical protein
MTHKRMLLASVLPLVIAGLMVGCDQTPSDSSSGLIQDFSYAFADDQLETSNSAGVDVDGASGVFSIGWRQMIVPEDQTTTLRGDAMAIAFDGTQDETAPFRTLSGIDMGTVYLNYSGNHRELAKKEGHRRGVFYALFPERPEPTEPGLEFVAGGSYEFEMTGSEAFSPLKVSLTAPQELLQISSHTNGDQINPSSDLTVTWTGGSADGGVLVRLRPFFLPPTDGMRARDRFMQGIQHGGPKHQWWSNGGGEGHGPGRGHGFGPMRFHRGFFIKLDSNPGTYTIPADEIQNVLGLMGTTEIAVTVAQISATSVDHDAKSYKLLVRNGDMRVLATQ